MQYTDELHGMTTTAAPVRYVLHRDVPNKQWNVYKKVGLYEEYVDSFTDLSAAQAFCDKKNGITGS